MYGSGVSAVFSTAELAKTYIAKQFVGYTTYDLGEYNLDSETER